MALTSIETVSGQSMSTKKWRRLVDLRRRLATFPMKKLSVEEYEAVQRVRNNLGDAREDIKLLEKKLKKHKK